MADVIWTVREESFLDFWEQCTRPADASEVGLSRNAFMAGMAAATHFERRETWRCFHCDEVFDRRHAAQMHFGYTECSDPACRIKAGAEGSILEALRRAETDAEAATAAMHDESSEGWRAYHNLASRVREQVEAAENLGYERGLRDGRLDPSPAVRVEGSK